ncbi:hypothetical protein [Methylobacterium indicum]|uniref:hypothetical protein n=1 Tax=Methylobacterium indicum TaxID=1775910 RepID=UPI001FCCCD72|nr:hypothetical protein [Methylobacterium indicum]
MARRLHLTPAQFDAVRPRLFMRGFPRPDPDTGMYCLEAIDRWRHLRHPSLFPELVALGATQTPAIHAEKVDMVERAREGEEWRRRERLASRGRAKPLGAIDAEAEQKRREARPATRMSDQTFQTLAAEGERQRLQAVEARRLGQKITRKRARTTTG